MKSVRKTTISELVINKSTFITILFPCNNIDDFKNTLDQIKNEHSEANHHCYAYRIGLLEKANDDGEPAKTAGAPILNVLQKQKLDNTACIVVRYFGGIKLGAGGLVRAYSNSASEAIMNAEIVDKQLVDIYKLAFGYNLITLVENVLKRYNIQMKDKDFLDEIVFHCYIENKEVIQHIIDATSNQVSIELVGQELKEKRG